MRLALAIILWTLLAGSIAMSPFIIGYMVRRGRERRWQSETRRQNAADRLANAETFPLPRVDAPPADFVTPHSTPIDRKGR